jgi:hypothetical protein
MGSHRIAPESRAKLKPLAGILILIAETKSHIRGLDEVGGQIVNSDALQGIAKQLKGKNF